MMVSPHNLKRYLGIPTVAGSKGMISAMSKYYDILHWQDHLRMEHARDEGIGTCNEDIEENTVLLITEPYPIGEEALAEILSFSNDFDLHIWMDGAAHHVDSVSHHALGCSRIIFWKKHK